MADEIVHLSASDYVEMIGFLTYSFQESRRFDRVWPALYLPTEERMRCNLAIRRRGTGGVPDWTGEAPENRLISAG